MGFGIDEVQFIRPQPQKAKAVLRAVFFIARKGHFSVRKLNPNLVGSAGVKLHP